MPPDRWTQYYRLTYRGILSEPFTVIALRVDNDGMSIADSMLESAKQMKSFVDVVMVKGNEEAAQLSTRGD